MTFREGCVHAGLCHSFTLTVGIVYCTTNLILSVHCQMMLLLQQSATNLRIHVESSVRLSGDDSSSELLPSSSTTVLHVLLLIALQ